MEKAKVYLFTSPTCPNCPPAKKFIQEFKQQRDDFEFVEFSTMTRDGQKTAQKYNVMSVPTFIIKGNGFPDPIGLVGTQRNDVMNKYIDIALGKKTLEDFKKPTLKEKLSNGIKLGPIRIKF
jgi:predicted DsbA family dithiol-disulfide isomerase